MLTFYKETNFKKTEIGKISKDWNVVKVGDILSLEYGKGLAERERTPGGYPVVGSNGIVGYHNKVLIKGPGIVVGRKGTIGAVSWIAQDFWPIDTTYYVKPKISEIFLKWLFYELTYLDLTRFHLADVVPGLKRELVHSLKMPLPSLLEQQKIAEVLSTVDEAIQKTEEVIVKTEHLKKGLMQELLTKGVILGFMFDTNIFDALLDGRINLEQLSKQFNYYVTHIQRDEIDAISRPEKRERKRGLLQIFKELKNEEIPTESSVWDISRWGKAKWGEADLYDKLLSRLQELDKRAGKKKSKENQIRDVLIAETCIKNFLILVSNDENLRIVTREFGGQAITFRQFLNKEYREYKNTEIGRIPKDWEVVRLKEVGKFINGFGFPIEYQGKKDGRYIFAKVSDTNLVENEKYVFTAKNTIDDDLAKKLGVRIYPTGTIIFPKIGMVIYLRKVRILSKPGTFDNNIMGIIPAEDAVDNEFLYYYFLEKIDLTKLSGRTTAPSIRKTEVEKLKIHLPPLLEQQKIAEILSTVDKKLEFERSEKSKLERIKQGLMDLLLAGKVRIIPDNGGKS